MIIRKYLVCAAVLAAGTVLAADDAEADTAAEDSALADLPQPQDKPELKPFTTLPLCRRAQSPVNEGTVEVKKPGQSEWVPAEEGKYYPLGTSYRTSGKGALDLAFGPDAVARITGDAAFDTRAQPLYGDSRTIILKGGTLELALPQNLHEGGFVVTSPGFTVRNPTRESKFVFEDKGDGYEATVRCVSGSFMVEGRHFSIPKMQAANEFRIRSSRDDLETVLWGKSGDFIARLDRGIVTTTVVQDDGTVKDISESASLDWHLSPETRVQINRAVPSVGERMSVTMMTFDPAGTMKNNFAFAEGRAEVNSGELVRVVKGDGEDIARKAAEATEEAAAIETEDAAAEETTEAAADDE